MTIGVEAQMRQQGIGSTVLKKIVFALQKAGCNRIFLHVKADNITAIKFYTSKGFRRTLLKDSFYLIEDKYYDAFEMTLDIPDKGMILTEDDLDKVMKPTTSELASSAVISKTDNTGIFLLGVVISVIFFTLVLLWRT